MATIKFEIEKKKEQSSVSIFLRFRHQSKQFKFYPGHKIEIKDWNEKKQRLKGNSKEAIDINDNLNLLEASLKEIVREQRNSSIKNGDRDFLIESVKQSFLDKFSKKENQKSEVVILPKIYLYDLFDFYIQEKKHDLAPSNIRVYKRVAKNIRNLALAKGISMELANINKQFFIQFKGYMIGDLKYLNSTISKDIKRVKCVLRYFQDDYMEIGNDFLKIKTSKDESYRYTCTELEMLSLYQFQYEDTKIYIESEKRTVLVKKELLNKVRDIFCFSFSTGLAYTELLNLDESNIKTIEFEGKQYQILDFNRQKTKKQIQVPLNSLAIEIIQKYKGKQKRLLPVFTNQRMNFYLHIALKNTGLFDDIVQTIRYSGNQRVEVVKPRHKAITMHSARHGFATNLVNSGFPLSFIQNLLGHSSIKTTEIYAKVNPLEMLKEFKLLEKQN